MRQDEIKQVFEVLGLSSGPGPLEPMKTPSKAAEPKQLVFIAAESTSQPSEITVNAKLEPAS